MKKFDTTRKIDALTKALSSLDRKLAKTNERIDKISAILLKLSKLSKLSEIRATEQLLPIRAKTERFPEQTERSLIARERAERIEELSRIRGRHREILAMLINDGFHTYSKIAQKLGISQSRARAYIAELKNVYGVPLRQVRDPEGYKVGIDVRFVEEILTFR